MGGANRDRRVPEPQTADHARRSLKLEPPRGAMYAFIGVDTTELPEFDDQQFALDLLEQKHVLVAPGVSFNVAYRNHFRVTTLPDAATLRTVFARIEELLDAEAAAEPRSRRGTVVEAQNRFK